MTNRWQLQEAKSKFSHVVSRLFSRVTTAMVGIHFF